MIRNALVTIAGRRAAGVLGHALERSPFYGISSTKRQQLVDHIKGWEGSRVRASKRYKELIETRDGFVKHPNLLGGCDEQERRLMKYAKYNDDFLQAELAFAINEEEKRQTLPRKKRMSRGDLAEVSDFDEQKKKNVFSLKCSRLPPNHNLTPGQSIKLTETRHDHGVDCNEVIDLQTVGVGTITKVNFHDAEIVVDFSDNSDKKVNLSLFSGSTYDIEIAFNVAAFQRMEKVVEEMKDSKSGPLHLWLIMFLESMYSKHSGFGILSDKIESEVDDIYDMISAHRESNLINTELLSDSVQDGEEDYVCVLSKRSVESNLLKMLNEGRYSLNKSQQHAVLRSLSSYISLIQGPPGCGKTHTAACIVKIWLETTGSKKKALVLAQSNKAVDQLCSAMLRLSLNITRIGTAPKLQENIKDVHVDAQLQELVRSITNDGNSIQKVTSRPWGEGYARTGYFKKDLINEVIAKADVICTTCIGSRHEHLLTLDPEDVGLIVMDEATQASELECLVPLTAFPHAQIIMIGDHKQLPPTILSDEARKGGREYSLFERLIDFGIADEIDEDAKAESNVSEIGAEHIIAEETKTPTLFASIMLMEQYRMHPDISSFSNKQFYEGMLSDGITAQQRMLPKPDSLWPSIEETGKSCVAFVPTSGKEVRTHSRSFSNQTEVGVIVSIAKKLLSSGLKPEEMGIISPYMGQVVALKRALKEAKVPVVPKKRKKGATSIVEVNTVDAFQGSEKDVIIISTVRANERGSIGFLKDKRRMNVALTRAKRGLVVVGDPSTLKCDPCWKEWLQHYEAHSVKVKPTKSTMVLVRRGKSKN